MTPRILSGIQPSGKLHLGNYFGAIKQHVELQDKGEAYYFIANYHALTSTRDRAKLLEMSRDVALTYLACGLDPARCVFYRQSDVPEVTEITWLLCTVTGMGLLEKAHSYKDKVAHGISPSVGLFTYPALMAADILAPRADIVPVGKDQEQHVELTRDMASAFNHAFDREVFTIPRSQMSPTPRVPGTTYEKGQILQVSTTLARRRADGTPVEVDDYVAFLRGAVAGALEGSPGLKGTEELEASIHLAHEGAGWVVEERTLRTLAEQTGSEPFVVGRDGGIGVELCLPLDRVLFHTQGGRKVAAKMSKSYGNAVEIFAQGKPLKKKIMGIETEPRDLEDPLDPEGDLVVELYKLMASPDEVAELEANYRRGGFGYGRAKQALLARMEETFAPFRARRAELEQDPDYVEDVLVTGGRVARAVARETLEAARDAVGIPATR